MAVHRSLRFEFNLWLVVSWGLALFALLLYTRGMVARLAGLGMLLGGVAGFLQHLALVEGKKALLAAASAPEVRSALAATRSGARYLQLVRATLVVAAGLTVLELVAGPPMGKDASPLWLVARAAFDYAAVLLGFALARPLVAFPSLWRLERSAP